MTNCHLFFMCYYKVNNNDKEVLNERLLYSIPYKEFYLTQPSKNNEVALKLENVIMVAKEKIINQYKETIRVFELYDENLQKIGTGEQGEKFIADKEILSSIIETQQRALDKLDGNYKVASANTMDNDGRIESYFEMVNRKLVVMNEKQKEKYDRLKDNYERNIFDANYDKKVNEKDKFDKEVRDNIENNKDGINKVKCTNNKCTISYNDKNTGVLVLNLDDKTIHYEMTKPGDSNKYDVYDRKLDSSLSDVTLSSSISGEVTIDSNIYFKISGKNIYTKKVYNIIIPIDNLKKDDVCNIPSVGGSVRLVDYIKDLYSRGEKKVVTNNGIEYNTVECLGLINDRLGGTTTDYDDGNIRYYGENPNNYIYFNCDDYSNQTDSTCEK